MKPLDRIFETARENRRTIVLPEGEDPRIQAAALRASREGLANVVLLGNRARIGAALQALGAKPDEIVVEDPATTPDFDEIAEGYHKLRAHKGVTAEQARQAAANPMVHAALRVRLGHADGTVGGAVATTSETVRVALQIIGCEKGIKTVSSFFLMLACAPDARIRGGMIFSDCGLVVDPNAEELAAIARASAETCRRLLDTEPSVALLSFSTAGSAEHESLTKIRDALAIVRAAEPDLQIDGEIQFDAALDETIRSRKAPNSALKTQPNVFIFPNLSAGNIGYKIAERLGGLTAIGPILQGLALPANDLSRGCSVDDVIATIAVTAAQASRNPPVADRFGLGQARHY